MSTRLTMPRGVQTEGLAGEEKATVARTARAADSGSSLRRGAMTLTRIVPSGDPGVGGAAKTPSSRDRPGLPLLPGSFGSWKLPHGVRATTGSGLVATWSGLTLKTLI